VRTYLDGGLVVNGMLPGRPDDKFGIAFIHTRLSDRLRQLDREAIAQGVLTTPPRDHETNVELTYVAQVLPGWTVQPTITWVAHPSGTGVRLPDARVIGLRSVMRF
jgi:porin